MKKSNVTPVQVSAQSRAAISGLLPEPIKVVQTPEELDEVFVLWKETYRSIYPHFSLTRKDPFNDNAYILYTRNEEDVVNSCARLAVDSDLGLPEDDYFPKEINMYREMGNNLMEFGRFIINGGDLDLLKAYYKAVYQIARAEGVDVIPMAMKQKDVAFHRNLIGAYLLQRDINLPHGGKDRMSCVSWEIANTKERFFRWAGLPQEQKEGAL